MKEGLATLMSEDAYLKETVVGNINVGMLPNIIDIEGMFQECATKDRDFWCTVSMDMIAKMLGQSQSLLNSQASHVCTILHYSTSI